LCRLEFVAVSQIAEIPHSGGFPLFIFLSAIMSTLHHLPLYPSESSRAVTLEKNGLASSAFRERDLLHLTPLAASRGGLEVSRSFIHGSVDSCEFRREGQSGCMERRPTKFQASNIEMVLPIFSAFRNTAGNRAEVRKERGVERQRHRVTTHLTTIFLSPELFHRVSCVFLELSESVESAFQLPKVYIPSVMTCVRVTLTDHILLLLTGARLFRLKLRRPSIGPRTRLDAAHSSFMSLVRVNLMS
jgi:hypothetical protein